MRGPDHRYRTGYDPYVSCHACPYNGHAKRAYPHPHHSQVQLPPPPSPEQLLRQLLFAIANEEQALADLVRQEASKIKYVTQCMVGPLTPDEIIAVQKSIADVLDRVVKKEELLLKKLRLIFAMCPKEDDDLDVEE